MRCLLIIIFGASFPFSLLILANLSIHLAFLNQYTLSHIQLTQILKSWLEDYEFKHRGAEDELKLWLVDKSGIRLLSQLKNYILPSLKKVYLDQTEKDPDNVEYFLGHCLPQSLDILVLSSGEVFSRINPPIDKFMNAFTYRMAK